MQRGEIPVLFLNKTQNRRKMNLESKLKKILIDAVDRGISDIHPISNFIQWVKRYGLSDVDMGSESIAATEKASTIKNSSDGVIKIEMDPKTGSLRSSLYGDDDQKKEMLAAADIVSPTPSGSSKSPGVLIEYLEDPVAVTYTENGVSLKGSVVAKIDENPLLWLVAREHDGHMIEVYHDNLCGDCRDRVLAAK